MKGPHLILFHDKEEAAYFYTDLVTLEGTPDRTLFFPSSYKRSVQYQQTDEANIITRTQTLRRLTERRVSSFIISYAEALVESVVTRRQLGETTLEVKQGDPIVGRKCPWCRFMIRAGDRVVKCPCGKCSAYFHNDIFRHLTCWNDWNDSKGNDYCPITGARIEKKLHEPKKSDEEI